MELTEMMQFMNETAEKFAKDAEANLKGNKAAGTRARKATLLLNKLGRQYRAATIAADKEKKK